jgi:hypothetical protein
LIHRGDGDPERPIRRDILLGKIRPGQPVILDPGSALLHNGLGTVSDHDLHGRCPDPLLLGANANELSDPPGVTGQIHVRDHRVMHKITHRHIISTGPGFGRRLCIAGLLLWVGRCWSEKGVVPCGARALKALKTGSSRVPKGFNVRR